ncbi:MAG: hypothetical protein LBQ54_06585 [Planctomycetaceae bacterium]|jgi:tetratricopeptide (TPR) repeat protein|nr:hypothetical protein [Planctomycetaceae bacterium]
MFFAAMMLVNGIVTAADTVSVYRKEGDSLYDANAVTTRSQQGTITGMSPTVVTLVDRASQERGISVNEIDSIRFDEEPAALSSVRLAIQTGNFDTAAQTLEKIDTTGITRKYILEEIAFFKAYLSAQSAMNPGKTEKEITAGAKSMFDFIKSNPENWHVIAANEIIGDLMVLRGTGDVALRYYKPLMDSSWPEYQMRGRIAVADINLAADRINEAKAAYEAVLNAEDKSYRANLQKSYARLGLARCAAKEGNPEQGLTMTEEVIKTSGTEDVSLNAAAYNTLGDISLLAGKKNDALLAYLHVDLLYPKAQPEHIKALQKLVTLWKEKGKTDRESEVRQTLKTRYGVAVE